MTLDDTAPFYICDQGDGWWQGERRTLMAQLSGGLPPRPADDRGLATITARVVEVGGGSSFSARLEVDAHGWDVVAGERPYTASVRVRAGSKPVARFDAAEGISSDVRAILLAPGYFGDEVEIGAQQTVDASPRGRWAVVGSSWSAPEGSVDLREVDGYETRVVGLSTLFALVDLSDPIEWRPAGVRGISGQQMVRVASQAICSRPRVTESGKEMWVLPVGPFRSPLSIDVLNVFCAGKVVAV